MGGMSWISALNIDVPGAADHSIRVGGCPWGGNCPAGVYHRGGSSAAGGTPAVGPAMSILLGFSGRPRKHRCTPSVSAALPGMWEKGAKRHPWSRISISTLVTPLRWGSGTTGLHPIVIDGSARPLATCKHTYGRAASNTTRTICTSGEGLVGA